MTSMPSLEAELAHLLDEMIHEVYVFDAETLRFKFVNRAGRQRLGYSSVEVRQLTFLDKAPRLTAVSLATILEPLNKNQQRVIQLETVLQTKNSELYPVKGVVKRIMFEAMPAFLATLEDVSHLKSNMWTSSSEEELATIIETTPECVKVIDAEGRLLRMNAAGLEMIGASNLKDVQGKSVYPIVASEYRDKFIAFNEYICAGNKGLLEFDIVGLKGTRRRMDTHAVPIFDNESKSVVHLAITRDVTEQKQAVEDRLNFERQMQHVQKLESLGILAGGIAHDFNNLLTSILGNAELAKRLLPPEGKAANYLDRVMQGSIQASKLTKQMLAYAGKESFVLTAVHLSSLIEEMSPLLEVTLSKKTTIKHDFFPNLPHIEGDPAQIQQIIINLIMNASEAIGDKVGSMTLSTNVAHYSQQALKQTYLDENLPPGTYVYLEVVDNGCGMSADVKKKLFDPFFTTKFTGRGLGLAAVLGIVRGHRGAIQIQSEEGVGTVVRVLFPVSSKTNQKDHFPINQSELWRSSGTVLVVDDDAAVRDLAQDLLQEVGFDVLTADDGDTGLRLFAKEAANLRFVLLDLMMPNLNGDEVLDKMSDIRPNVPVILTSGFSDVVANQSTLSPNFFGFLQKPYTYHKFLDIVQRVIDFLEKAPRQK